MAVARPAGPAPTTRMSVSITPAGRGPLVSVRVVMAPESPRCHGPGSVARTDFISVAAQAAAPGPGHRHRSSRIEAAFQRYRSAWCVITGLQSRPAPSRYPERNGSAMNHADATGQLREAEELVRWTRGERIRFLW